jgi:predicted PurR-regulated permease PerM
VVASLVGSLLDLATNLFFILTLVLFLTMDATAFPDHLARSGVARGPLVDALIGFAVGTRSYLVVSTVFGLIVAVIDTAALALLGIPVPLLWGLLAFITNYIPNIGFVIGLVPPAVLGLLEGGPGLCIAVVVVYCLVNLVIQTVIQPKIVGDTVGLSTSLTFISLVFWAWVLGALGALLAIPLSLLVKAVLVDIDPRTRWLVPLLSNRAAADDEEPVGS